MIALTWQAGFALGTLNGLLCAGVAVVIRWIAMKKIS